jgi:hypothetical protein
VSTTVVDTRTRVTLSGLLRQLADGLDEATGLGVPEPGYSIFIHPFADDDQAVVRAVDLLGWVLLGHCGRPEVMNDQGVVHYEAATEFWHGKVAIAARVTDHGQIATQARTNAGGAR